MSRERGVEKNLKYKLLILAAIILVALAAWFFLVPQKTVPSGYKDTYLLYSWVDGVEYSITQEQGQLIMEVLKSVSMHGSLNNPYYRDRESCSIDLVFSFLDEKGFTKEVRRLSIAKVSGGREAAFLSYNPFPGRSLLRLYGKVTDADQLYDRIMEIIGK